MLGDHLGMNKPVAVELSMDEESDDDTDFESDDEEGRKAILTTIKADFSSRFSIKLEGVKLHPEIRDSLQKWHDHHGAEWLENLYTAWMNGRYNGVSSSNVSADLQMLRNTNGHSVIKLLTA